MNVFFYGLFMDGELLGSKGIVPRNPRPGYVDGFELRIGERATLVRRAGRRAYGVVMDVASDDVGTLYAEASVADYSPEPVIVETKDGNRVDACCYNLPPDRVSGANRQYAQRLLAIADELAFPDSYLDEIRRVAR